MAPEAPPFALETPAVAMTITRQKSHSGPSHSTSPITLGSDRTSRSLYERANGYNHEAVKIFMPALCVGSIRGRKNRC
jgi:hypothetical protein